jgi:hypothetical protein
MYLAKNKQRTCGFFCWFCWSACDELATIDSSTLFDESDVLSAECSSARLLELKRLNVAKTSLVGSSLTSVCCVLIEPSKDKDFCIRKLRCLKLKPLRLWRFSRTLYVPHELKSLLTLSCNEATALAIVPIAFSLIDWQLIFSIIFWPSRTFHSTTMTF